MRLPNSERAVVADRKMTDYLLSEERSEGKAAFFIALGFSPARLDILRNALLAHAASYDVAKVVETAHGKNTLSKGL